MGNDQPSSAGVEALERAARLLLEQHPDAITSTMNREGLLVSAPDGLDLPDRQPVQSRNPLDVIAPSDRVKVIGTWERALEAGGAHDTIRLQGGGTAELYLFDLTRDLDVVLSVIVPVAGGRPDLTGMASRAAAPPRLCRVRKNETARIVAADDAVAAMLGWSAEDVLDKRSLDFIHPDDHERAINSWMDILGSPGGSARTRVRHLHRDGRWVWVELINQNLLRDPDAGYVDCDIVDIDEEMAALEALHANEQLLRRLADALPVGVLQVDGDLRVVYANDRLYEILGLDPGASEREMHACIEGGDIDTAFTEVLAGNDLDLDIMIRRGDGTGRRHCTAGLRTLTDSEGNVTGAVACLADVTDQVQLRSELERRAAYDALTGCVNRATVMGVLDDTLASARIGTAVLFVDLDGFKTVNDRAGHAIGDSLLVATASRLRESVRAGDVVGRIGGDEFLVVCPNVAGEQAALELGDRLAETLVPPVTIDGHRLSCRASVGVAWTDVRDQHADALVASADGAMYEAKAARGGRAVLAGSDTTGRRLVEPGPAAEQPA